jgi:hypothetical protein
MLTFKIVREQGGWAVQLGCAVTLCKSRAAAIAQARRMAEAIRRHGEVVTVVVEPAMSPVDEEVIYFAPSAKAAAAERIRVPRRVLRAG